MNRRFCRGVAVVAGSALLTAMVLLLVTAHALMAKPGEWSVPVRFGLFGLGPVIDARVSTLVRIATHPLGIAILDGRRITTSSGTLSFTRLDTDRLAIACRPCRFRLSPLGDEAITVASVRIALVQQVDRVDGEFRAGTIVGRFRARYDDRGAKVDLQFDEAPIAAWYALFGDAIPETRVASITGQASFDAKLSLPDGRLAVKPAIAGFTVSGLGTELLAGRMPDVACGREASRARASTRLTTTSWLARAVVAAEDQRYAEHPGYDLVELAASLSRNGDARSVERGASTIPQQLARMLYVGSDRTVSRKLRELLYAVEMDRTLGKARMLQLYLAVAPWGEDTCGAEAASRRYFGIPAAKLDAAQSVWLAAMLHAPDTEFDAWRARGGIDLARATRVANGLGAMNKATRKRLADGLALLAHPPLAEVAIVRDERVEPVLAAGTVIQEQP